MSQLRPVILMTLSSPFLSCCRGVWSIMELPPTTDIFSMSGEKKVLETNFQNVLTLLSFYLCSCIFACMQSCLFIHFCLNLTETLMIINYKCIFLLKPSEKRENFRRSSYHRASSRHSLAFYCYIFSKVYEILTITWY